MDEDRILNKLGELETYLGKIEGHLPATFDEYMADELKRSGIERFLHIAIECTIDIASMLVIGLRLGVPANEEDMFAKLAPRGIIEKHTSERLQDMKRFRNILVHRYAYVDDRRVYEILTEDLDDIWKFIGQVKEFMKKN